MAYAISVFFDAATDQAVRDLWRAVDEAGISSVLARGPYNPHLTLAICQHLDVNAFRADLERWAAEEPTLTLRFASIGAFPGEQGVVFFAATMSLHLLMLHTRLYNLLDQCGDGFSPYYERNAWNPHSTLAVGLTDSAIPEAVALCRNHLSDTIVATITHIGIVDTPAEVELCRVAFAGKRV